MQKKLTRYAAAALLGAGSLSLISNAEAQSTQPASPSIFIQDTTGPFVNFTFSGFDNTAFGPIQILQGAEFYEFVGTLNPVPGGLTAGGGAAFLSEPGQPGVFSDYVAMEWDDRGSVFGLFISVDGSAIAVPPIDPSWISYPETGGPVSIPTLGVDPFFTGGVGGTVPFTLTIQSSVPDGGATLGLLSTGLFGLMALRRKI